MKHFNHSILAVFGFLAAAAQASDYTPSLVEFKSTVLTFGLGRSELSADDFKTLEQAIADAKAVGKISKIEVAAWSDKDHPVTGDLSKAELDKAFASDARGHLAREDLALIKAEGAASKAVVILKVRDRK
jgi:hypothetical protein